MTRELDPHNRRSVLITLTDRGRALVDHTVACHIDLEEKLLGALTGTDQERLAGLLRTLLIGLGDASPGNTA